MTRVEYWGFYHDRAAMIASLPPALEAERRKHGKASSPAAARANLLDYAPPENFEVARRFPSLAMAKAWAARHLPGDCFGCVEVRVIEIIETRSGDESEEVQVWHLAGGDDPATGWYRADQ